MFAGPMHHRGPQTFITVHISSADICKICVYSLCLGFQFSVSEYGLDKLSFSLSPPQHGASERFQRPGQKFGVKCEGCLRVWGSWQDFRSVEMEIRSRLWMCPAAILEERLVSVATGPISKLPRPFTLHLYLHKSVLSLSLHHLPGQMH